MILYRNVESGSVSGVDDGERAGLDVVHHGLGDDEVSRVLLLGGDGSTSKLGHLIPGVTSFVANVLGLRKIIAIYWTFIQSLGQGPFNPQSSLMDHSIRSFLRLMIPSTH